MRRKDREIQGKEAIEDVIRKSVVCRLAMSDENRPYVVPLCFGYENNTLYFHTAPEGKKIEILKRNQKVCFEFDTGTAVVRGTQACKWAMKYQSVIGFGDASFIEDDESKRRALDIIMKQYASGTFSFLEEPLRRATVIRVQIESMTGKKSD